MEFKGESSRRKPLRVVSFFFLKPESIFLSFFLSCLLVFYWSRFYETQIRQERSSLKAGRQAMASMEGLIGLMNRIQRACTALGDHGGGEGANLPTLWESLPTIAVVGGQVICFLPSLLQLNGFFLFSLTLLLFLLLYSYD